MIYVLAFLLLSFQGRAREGKIWERQRENREFERIEKESVAALVKREKGGVQENEGERAKIERKIEKMSFRP